MNYKISEISISRIFTALLIFFAILRVGEAAEYHVSLMQRDILLNAQKMQMFYHITNAPAEVLALCNGGPNGIAEPGENWNDSDTVTNSRLPFKRLIWGAAKDGYYVIHYESGGIAHTFHILFARFDSSGGAMALWRAHGGTFKNYNEFVRSFKRNKLQEDRLSSIH